MNMVKTLHVPIYRDDNGRQVHLATVRSDWSNAAFLALADVFPDCHVESQRQRINRRQCGYNIKKTALSELGDECFQKLRKYAAKNLPDAWYFDDNHWIQG
jgi:hypothetical protein